MPCGREVTLVVTACGRNDLLERCLKTFHEFNTYPLYETILIEDGPEKLPKFQVANLKYIANGKRIGQVSSIDKAYTEVMTPYIMHSEDDWEFYRSGFIEASLEVLEKYGNILQVWIRAHDDTNGHPIVRLPEFDVATMDTNYEWCGFSWNPGLRRLSDYQLLGDYSRFKYQSSGVTENRIGKAYKALGYHCAILPEPTGYTRHTGWGRSLMGGLDG